MRRSTSGRTTTSSRTAAPFSAGSGTARCPVTAPGRRSKSTSFSTGSTLDAGLSQKGFTQPSGSSTDAALVRTSFEASVQLEELSLKLADVRRIEPFAERGRTGEVGEENGYDPPLLTVVARVAGSASVIPEGDAAVGAEGRSCRLLESAGGAGPLERRAALTAKTGARSVLGSAGSTDQSHRGESTEATFGAGATQGWLDRVRTGHESPSDRQKGGSCDSSLSSCSRRILGDPRSSPARWLRASRPASTARKAAPLARTLTSPTTT